MSAGFYGTDYVEAFDPGPEDNPTLAASEDDAVERALAFNRDVAREVRRIRVREAAARRVAAEDEPPGGFDLGTLAEVLERPAEPAARVAGLIPWEAGTLVAAQRKTGKTTLSLNLARCLLTGEDFLGRFTVRPLVGAVGLLNFEMAALTAARWAKEHGVPGDRLVLVNLRGRRNPLRHPEDRERLARQLREREVESLLVDPFGRAYTGQSQNDSGEVGAWLVDLDLFARAEVGARDLILSAHAGWNGERTRGASALEDWADSIITLTRDPQVEDSPRYLRAVGRDVEVAEDRLDFHAPTRRLRLTGEGSRKQSRDHQKHAELAVCITRAARNDPGITVSGLRVVLRGMDDAPDFRADDVQRATALAVEQGFLRVEDGGSGRAKRHFATNEA